jgi:outer membrane lipoprotein-sorting protein
MISLVMTAAILAVLTAAQQTPAERLTQFLNSASDRSVTFSVADGSGVTHAVLSYQHPNYQYMRYETGGVKGEFFQTSDRVLLVDHADQTYYEYKGFEEYVGLPPESGLLDYAYPSYLYAWTKSDSLKNALPSQAPTGADKSLDWLKQSVETQGVVTVFHIGIGKGGEPVQLLIQVQGGQPIKITFEKFGWPEKDMREWKYQPPVGYSLGSAPKLHRPFQAGNRVEWGKWVDGQGKSINMDQLNSTGVAVVFTSTGGPDQSLVSDLGDLKKSLAKLKVNLVEVHLDEKSAPKRDWPVTLDTEGTITKQFDPPHTPYIFFVRKDRYVIGGWAGYGRDQKEKLIKTANDLYSSQAEE